MDIQVFENLPKLAQKAADLMTGPQVAISGGSTYAALFYHWAKVPRLKNLQYFVVDERQVPYDHEGCNWRVATEKFLEPLGAGAQKTHWAQSAIQYEAVLKEKVGFPPVFSQIFLGMGDDGHTASLFPGGPELKDTQSSLLVTTSPKPPLLRLTLGLKVLWSCENLILIVTGKNKAGMVKRLVENDISLPVTLALQGHRQPVVLLDQEAAANI